MENARAQSPKEVFMLNIGLLLFQYAERELWEKPVKEDFVESALKWNKMEVKVFETFLTLKNK